MSDYSLTAACLRRSAILSMTQINEIGYAFTENYSDCLFIFSKVSLMISRKLCTWIGFVTYPSQPACMARLRSCGRVYALSAYKGMDFVISSDFNFCAAVHPSISGI